jgi:hypothetical protein
MLVVHATEADAGFQDFLKGAMKSLGFEQGLTESEIVDGLKDLYFAPGKINYGIYI